MDKGMNHSYTQSLVGNTYSIFLVSSIGAFWMTYGTFLSSFQQVSVSAFDMCGLPRGHFRRKASALRNLSTTGTEAVTPADVARMGGSAEDAESINSEQFALIMDKIGAVGGEE